MRGIKLLLKKVVTVLPEAVFWRFCTGDQWQHYRSTFQKIYTLRDRRCSSGELGEYLQSVPRTNISGTSVARDGSKVMASKHEFGSSCPVPKALGVLLAQARLHEAVTVVERMAEDSLPIRAHVLFSIVEGCIKHRNVAAGKRVYSLVMDRGLDADASMGKMFIRLFASEGYLADAHRVFCRIAVPKRTTWRAIISAFTNQGHGKEAVKLYQNMVHSGIQPNDFIYVHVLQACALTGAFREGRAIHAHIVKSGYETDPYVASALINMYAKCGNICHAQQVFDKTPKRNPVLWTTMIAGYAREGQGQEALSLYKQMQLHGLLANRVTFLCILKACAAISALGQGKQIHSQLVDRGLDSDISIGNALVDMYAKCGSLDEAVIVFDAMQEKDVVSWTALLRAYAQKGQAEFALQFFRKMQDEGVKPSKVTLLSVLTACSHAGKLEEGSQLFESMLIDFGIAPEVEHYACMVDLLGRAGHLREAKAFIDAMPLPPDSKVWTSLLWACRTYRDVELGQHCFASLVQLEPLCTSAYILMSQIYGAAGRHDDSIDVRNMIKLAGIKVAGRTWTEVHNSVVSFQADDKNHSQRKQIFHMLKTLTDAPM